MVTQAQKRATAKYNLTKYDRLNLRLAKNEKDELRKFIDEVERLTNEPISTNKFIYRLIEQARLKSPSEIAKLFNSDIKE